MAVVPLEKKVFVSSGFNRWMRLKIYDADIPDVELLGPDDFQTLLEIIQVCRNAGHVVNFWGVRLNFRDPKAKAVLVAYRRALAAGIALPRLVFQGQPSLVCA